MNPTRELQSSTFRMSDLIGIQVKKITINTNCSGEKQIKLVVSNDELYVINHLTKDDNLATDYFTPLNPYYDNEDFIIEKVTLISNFNKEGNLTVISFVVYDKNIKETTIQFTWFNRDIVHLECIRHTAYI